MLHYAASSSTNSHSNSQGPIEFIDLRWVEVTDEICQSSLANADKFITVNRTLMLEAFIDSNGYLSRQAIVHAIDRGADNRRELGID